MKPEYLDFELEIGLGKGREYPVAVLRSPAGEARATMHFPFDEVALERHLDKLQIALLRSGGTRRMALTQEQQDVQDFGRALFEALMTSDLRSVYDVSQQQSGSRGLRIKLRIVDPALAALPWEFLYDPRRSDFLCLSPQTPLVRYLELPQPLRPLVVDPPLRILGMIASPADLPVLDAEQEKERVARALSRLREDGLAELEWLPGQTWRDLQRSLRRGPWHVFHFVGHGGFDSNADEGLVILSDDQGKARPLRASELGRLLASHRSLRLAVLNACEGAKGSEHDIFSSTASILVRAGLPAVLAMQYEITDRAAIELSRVFYEAIADGFPVDAALAEARVAVNTSVTNTVEWGTPVLFMRAPDGTLFDLTGSAAPVHGLAASAVTSELTADPPAVTVQTDELRLALQGAQTSDRWLRRARNRWGLVNLAVVIVIAAVMIGYLTGVIGPDRGAVKPPSLAAATSNPETAAALASSPNPTITPVSSQTELAGPRDTGASSPAPVRDLSAPQGATLIYAGRMMTLTAPVEMELVQVPAGEFLMGSVRASDPEASKDEEPQHSVMLDEFYIGRYEVTNGQYAEFIRSTGIDPPSQWRNGAVSAELEAHPVGSISWNDAVEFTRWLSAWTGEPFRLCTEAEWEKACRGGEALVYPWGDTFDASRANTAEFELGTTTAVGSYAPDGDSPYGVSDMAGNVWEWVADWYGEYTEAQADNPLGPESGNTRGLRGGSFDFDKERARCANRDQHPPYLSHSNDGFRVCVAPPALSPGQ